MAAHALNPTAPLPGAAPHLRLVALRGATVWPAPPPLQLQEPVLSGTLKRCLLLALLLHVWLVLMLGSAPGGTAAPGQGVAGSLNITLKGPETPGATEEAAPPAPVLPEGPSGSAALPRWGGAVREQAQPLPATPGAAQLGRWAATPQPAEAREVPPPPPGRVVEERAEAGPVQLPVPVPAPVPVLADSPSTLPAPAPPPEPAPAPVERRLAANPAAAAPARLPELAPALAAPAVVPLPAPELAPLPAPAALTPRLQRPAPGTAAELPVLAPLTPAAPLAQVPNLPNLPSVPNLPASPAPPSLQAPPALPEPVAVPAPAPAAARPVAPAMAPSATPSTATSPTPAAASPSPSQAPPALPAAATTPGAPDAGSRLGSDVATPPAAAASVPPRLNLQLSRPRGGELSRGRSAGALPVLPRPPEVDDKLGRDIARSAKPDCREAHRGAGIVGALALAADALKTEGGCKW
jgi:Meckel syndrome type 1 protein